MNMKDMLDEEKEEMLRHKWIESEKAGHDVGDASMVQWTKEHAAAWRVGYNRDNLMDLGDGTRPIYFAVFLDEPSRKLLVDATFEMVPSGWTMLCHHCTLSFGDPAADPDVLDFIAKNLGTKVELEAVTVGKSSDAMAIGVSGDLRTRNAIPHITLAVPPGGKPVKSNYIREWEEFSLDHKLSGVVDSCPSHFKWRH